MGYFIGLGPDRDITDYFSARVSIVSHLLKAFFLRREILVPLFIKIQKVQDQFFAEKTLNVSKIGYQLRVKSYFLRLNGLPRASRKATFCEGKTTSYE